VNLGAISKRLDRILGDMQKESSTNNLYFKRIDKDRDRFVVVESKEGKMIEIEEKEVRSGGLLVVFG